MQLDEYKKLNEREHFYWWNIGRRRILERTLAHFLDRNKKNLSLLDCGCGPGTSYAFLSTYGKVTGVDNSSEAMKYAQAKGYTKLLQCGAEHMPLADAMFDAVSSLDVIEHIEDDTRALREMHRVIKPGGHLLLTAPGHQWLWSRHDEALEHKRRYSKQALKKKVEAAGFEVLFLNHFVMLGVPFLLARENMRRLSKFIFSNHEEHIDTYNILLPKFINQLLIYWMYLEDGAIRFLPFPFGSSILLVAKKKRMVSEERLELSRGFILTGS